jgi:prefoldin subunit 5
MIYKSQIALLAARSAISAEKRMIEDLIDELKREIKETEETTKVLARVTKNLFVKWIEVKECKETIHNLKTMV